MTTEPDRLGALLRVMRRPKPPVGTTPADVVLRDNKWRLLRYRSSTGAPAKYATPVLLVPSLINRHYVLDLLPGKSFAEFMVEQGHDVYIIDWGTPEDEDRYVTFDDVCDLYVGRALRAATRISGADQAHLLGYCLGGTLTAIHTCVRPERVRSLTLLAAPVAFDDEGLLAKWTQTPSFDVAALARGLGNVPWQLMQSAFHMLRPTLTAQKAVTFIDLAWNDEFVDGFLAIEAWGNDNVSFPGACYERYVEELYRKNALVEGTFALSGEPALLENIRCPTLAMTFEHDTIVPWKSASRVIDEISSTDKHHVHVPGGHVGAVVSKKAASALWPAISDFWAKRDVRAEGD